MKPTTGPPKRLIQILSLLCMLLLGGGWLTPAAQAEEYPVDCGDFRNAVLIGSIAQANANPGPDTLVLAEGCTYTLFIPNNGHNALPVITDDLIIEGNGATIERDSQSAAQFRILSADPNADLIVRNLTIQNGYAVRLGSDRGNGGGIYARAALSLTNVTIRDNYAEGAGGGVYAAGPVTVRDSYVINNRSIGPGGGVSIAAGSSITHTYFERNQAEDSGGGLFTNGQLILRRSTFINNSTPNNGGGLALFGGVGTSHVVNNIWLHNIALSGGDAMVISLGGDAINVLHNTMVGPTPARGTGLFVEGLPNNQFNVFNNIITHFAVGVAQFEESESTVTTQTNLYFGNEQNELKVTTSGDHLEADPLFVDAINGEYQLRPESLAIDRGTDVGIGADIDSVFRPQGNGYDIGAYEYVVAAEGDSNRVFLPIILR